MNELKTIPKDIEKLIIEYVRPNELHQRLLKQIMNIERVEKMMIYGDMRVRFYIGQWYIDRMYATYNTDSTYDMHGNICYFV